MVYRPADGELAKVQLAEQDGARLAKPLDDGRIFVWDMVSQNPGACRRKDSSGMDNILYGNGNPMQRRFMKITGLDRLLWLGRLGQRMVSHYGDESAKVVVLRVYSVQVGLRKLYRRDVLALDHIGKV